MAVLPVLALLAACTAVPKVPEDTSADDTHPDTQAETGDTTDTADSTPIDTNPEDGDGDGFLPPEDCDDDATSVHPGADERWNGVDDDCDGIRDGDGRYLSSAVVRVTAIYKGDPYRYTLDCPTTLIRDNLHVDWEVVCTSSDDKLERRLLGKQLTISGAADNVGTGDWDGAAVVASSSGWDSSAEAWLTWEGFDTVSLLVSLSASSLQLTANSTMTRE